MKEDGLSDQQNNNRRDNRHREGDAVILPTPEEQADARIAEEKKQDNEYKKRQLAINDSVKTYTLLLVITSAIAGGISIWQARIAQQGAEAAQLSAATAYANTQVSFKQFELTRRVLKYSESANCTTEQLQAGDASINFQIFCNGKMQGIMLDGTLRMSSIALPDQRVVGAVESRYMKKGVILSDARSINIFPLPKSFSPSEFSRSRMGIRIEGEYTYSDGFDPVTQSLCQVWVPTFNRTDTNRNFRNGAALPCGQLLEYVEARKREGMYDQKKPEPTPQVGAVAVPK